MYTFIKIYIYINSYPVVYNYKMTDEIQWEVQQILQRGVRNGDTIYLVQWKGFPKSEATWEPISNLRHCKKCIQDFQNAFNQCFATKRKNKKREKGKNKKGLPEVSQQILIKNSEQIKCFQDQKNQENTNLPQCDRQPCQKQAEKEILLKEQNQNEVQTLEIFSPFYPSSQKQEKQIKQIIQQKPIKNNKNKRKSLKRKFNKLECDDEENKLASKKVKIQIKNQINQNQSQQDKKDQQEQLEQRQKEIDNVEEEPKIHLKQNHSHKDIELKQPITDFKSELQKINTLQQSNLVKATFNLQPLIQKTTIDQKVTLIQFLHQRKFICDSLLKRQTAFVMNCCLVQKIQKPNKNLQLIDLTEFPQLLEQKQFLRPIKQSEVDMTDFEILIRTRYGWLVVGKVQDKASIVDVQNLSIVAWSKLLEKYK